MLTLLARYTFLAKQTRVPEKKKMVSDKVRLIIKANVVKISRFRDLENKCDPQILTTRPCSTSKIRQNKSWLSVVTCEVFI